MLHLQTLVSALVPMSLLPYVSALSHPYVSALVPMSLLPLYEHRLLPL